MLLGSCETIIVSEAFSQKYIDRQKEISIKSGAPYFKYNDLLGKNVAFLSYVKEEKEISKELLAQIRRKLFQRGSTTDFFDSYLNETDVENRLNKNRALKQAKDIYLDSLVNVAVSDKDLSSKIGQFLNADNFLIYQVDLWPCDSCISKDIMSVKLRLVESANGAIIWTGISQKNEVLQEKEEMELTLHDLTDEVLDLFYNRFKTKWHVKRFESLKATTL